MSAQSTSDVPGIDQPSLERWFLANVPGAVAPFSYELIAGGHSNLTFKVTDAAGNQGAASAALAVTIVAPPGLAETVSAEVIHAVVDTTLPAGLAFAGLVVVGAMAMVMGSESVAAAAPNPVAWVHGTSMRSEPTMFARRNQINPQAGQDCAADVYRQARDEGLIP